MKTLYACGHNVFCKINPKGDALDIISIPQPVFSNIADARVIYVGMADIVVELTTKPTQPPILLLRGATALLLAPPRDPTDSCSCLEPVGPEITIPHVSPGRILKGVGHQVGNFLGVVMEDMGGIKVIQRRRPGGALFWNEVMLPNEASEWGGRPGKEGKIVDLSIAGSDEVAVVVEWDVDGSKQYTFHTHPSIQHLIPDIYPAPPSSLTTISPPSQYPHLYPLPSTHRPTSLISSLTSHALLLQPLDSHYSSMMLTTGDPRHPSLLLHPPDTRSTTPPRPLAPMSALEGLPNITHIYGNPDGWYLAAFDSQSSGAYIWGGMPNNRSRCLKTKIALTANEEVGEEEDIEMACIMPFMGEQVDYAGEEQAGQEETEIIQLAIGERYVLCMSSKGDVWGCGEGTNGELGNGSLDQDLEWSLEGSLWAKMRIEERNGWEKGRVVGVWAGGGESWVLVDEGDVGLTKQGAGDNGDLESRY